MKSVHFDNKSLELPTTIPKDSPRRAKRASHLDVLNKDVRSDLLFRLAMHQDILAHIQPHKSFLDLAAGIGITTRMFEAKHIHANDLDPECCKILKHNFPKANVTQHNYLDLPFKRNYDLILIDFDNYTVLNFGKHFKLLKRVFAHANQTVILCDCACFCMHVEGNRKGYAEYLRTPIDNYDDYCRAIKQYYEEEFPEWKLTLIEWFKNAAYVVFEKNTKRRLKVVRSNRKVPVHITNGDLTQYFPKK